MGDASVSIQRVRRLATCKPPGGIRVAGQITSALHHAALCGRVRAAHRRDDGVRRHPLPVAERLGRRQPASPLRARRSAAPTTSPPLVTSWSSAQASTRVVRRRRTAAPRPSRSSVSRATRSASCTTTPATSPSTGLDVDANAGTPTGAAFENHAPERDLPQHQHRQRDRREGRVARRLEQHGVDERRRRQRRLPRRLPGRRRRPQRVRVLDDPGSDDPQLDVPQLRDDGPDDHARRLVGQPTLRRRHAREQRLRALHERPRPALARLRLPAARQHGPAHERPRSSTTRSRPTRRRRRTANIGSASGVWANNIGGGWDCLPGITYRGNVGKKCDASDVAVSPSQLVRAAGLPVPDHDARRLDRPVAVRLHAQAGLDGDRRRQRGVRAGARPSRLPARRQPGRRRLRVRRRARRRGAGRKPGQRLAARRRAGSCAGRGCWRGPSATSRGAAARPRPNCGCGSAARPLCPCGACARRRPDPAVAQLKRRQAPQGRADPRRRTALRSLPRCRAGQGRDRERVSAVVRLRLRVR